MKIIFATFLIMLTISQTPLLVNKTSLREFNTCFQTSTGFKPSIDIGSDLAIVYGTSPQLPEKVESWRSEGYRVSFMTGISWGNYDTYYITESGLKTAEIQTDKTGKLWMHGNSKTVGYNVPTENYIEYIKKEILTLPIQLKVEHIFLEEPEFWAVTGWSEAFKQLWKEYYNSDWIPPNTSIETQYKASLLKYYLYTKALKETIQYIKKENTEKHSFGCYVPTHTLVNYAQWKIVSPESMLTKIEGLDGIIAQVWTGTARTPHHYNGILKERTFETAYLEYAQSVGMVIPTGKHLIFLADPIEDNPNHDWDDYRKNYEDTITASLLFPEVHTYEVMPWPNRIFEGEYPESKDNKNKKIKIPHNYATEILTVITALNYMKQSSVEWISENYPIGILISDTLMFQRAEPYPSDTQLNCFFGIATPLVKRGIPIKIVQLENILDYPVLEKLKILFLSYEGQKPLKEEYHLKLKKWVENGGTLIIIDGATDPYNNLEQWWKTKGFKSPIYHLLHILSVDSLSTDKPIRIGSGWVWWINQNPSELAKLKNGGEKIWEWLKEISSSINLNLESKNYFHLRRGPYHICSVMDETTNNQPYTLKGKFINLFDPDLNIIHNIKLAPPSRAILFDLNIALETSTSPAILISAGRVIKETKSQNKFSFTVRGPKDIPGKVIVYLDKPPKAFFSEEIPNTSYNYNQEYHLLSINFTHLGKPVSFDITLQ